jgi:hypothetical protein
MLLLMSDYNVNHGQNMIPLPKHQVNMKIHDIVYHSGNHLSYTQNVQIQMQEVAETLEELTDELEKPHPEIVKLKFRGDKLLEDQLWDLLIKIGKECVSSVVQKRSIALEEEEEEEAALVKNKAKTTDSTYEYSALA